MTFMHYHIGTSIMNRIRFVVLTLTVITSISASTVANAKEPKAATPLPIEQMRAVAYTKGFAKRFALPDPEPGTEPGGGIQAMEFAVEAGAKHTRGRHYCKLRLYLDSSLPIAHPEEGVMGSDRMFIFPAHFFLWPDPDNKRWLSLSIKDREHFSERGTRYNAMAWLATPDYPGYFEERPKKPYAAVGMFYEEYHRDLFSGLAYLKIDMGCPAYSWVDKVDVIQIWLKREGAKDYRKQLRKNPEDFLKFTIPQPFYRQIIQWTKRTAEHNRSLTEGEDAKRRHSQGPTRDLVTRDIATSETK